MSRDWPQPRPGQGRTQQALLACCPCSRLLGQAAALEHQCPLGRTEQPVFRVTSGNRAHTLSSGTYLAGGREPDKENS